MNRVDDADVGVSRTTMTVLSVEGNKLTFSGRVIQVRCGFAQQRLEYEDSQLVLDSASLG